MWSMIVMITWTQVCFSYWACNSKYSVINTILFIYRCDYLEENWCIFCLILLLLSCQAILLFSWLSSLCYVVSPYLPRGYCAILSYKCIKYLGFIFKIIKSVISCISHSWNKFSDSKFGLLMSAISSERAIQMKESASSHQVTAIQNGCFHC